MESTDTAVTLAIFTFRYASHDGAPWQSCTFAFTVNNVLNGYSGETVK